MNKDSIDIATNITITQTTAIVFTVLPMVPNEASIIINTRIKISVSPSFIHYMSIILLLSSDISPNPLITPFVGIKCEIPQNIKSVEPIITNIIIPPE